MDSHNPKNSSYLSHASCALSGKSQKLLSKVLSILRLTGPREVVLLRDDAQFSLFR